MKLIIVLLLIGLLTLSESASLVKRDSISDLISRGQTLLAQATAVQAQLNGAGRTADATALQAQIKTLETAISTLSHLDPNDVLQQAAVLLGQQVLKTQEDQIAKQLAALAAISF